MLISGIEVHFQHLVALILLNSYQKLCNNFNCSSNKV